MSRSQKWQTAAITVTLSVALAFMASAAFAVGRDGIARAAGLTQSETATSAEPCPMMAAGGSMAAHHAMMSGGGAGMMGKMHGMMTGSGHAAMLSQMHDGETKPAECAAMMGKPGMAAHMTAMMDGEDGMDPAQCQAWMQENGVSAETQAECLEHMAAMHPDVNTDTAK